MSGHSKWSQIKRKKAAVDRRKGKLFSKLSQRIVLAAKRGENPQMNSALRAAIEEAKSLNMPMEKIRRAIEKAKKTQGKGEEKELEYGVIGPYGLYLILKFLTDNQKRSLANLKQLLNRYQAKLGDVKWQFEKVGYVNFKIKNQAKEKIELALINLGVLDFEELEERVVAYTKPESFKKVVDFIKDQHLKIYKRSLLWRAKDYIFNQLTSLQIKEIERFIKEIGDLEDVVEIYSNFKGQQNILTTEV